MNEEESLPRQEESDEGDNYTDRNVNDAASNPKLLRFNTKVRIQHFTSESDLPILCYIT